MKSANTHSVAAPKISLAVQYVSTLDELPTRTQLRRWVGIASQRNLGMTLRIVDEAEGRALNLAYRGKDYATNVLTFVYDEGESLTGDVVICAPVVAREAMQQNKLLRMHYAHLTIHATLHLQGYDHENDADAEQMEARETALMLKLHYPDPYQEISKRNE